MAGQLDGKVAIVTGGAGGIGSAVARRLAETGAKVMNADVNDGKGQEVTSTIREAGGTCEYIHLDVCDESSWKNIVDETLNKFGSVDILANVAGLLRGEWDDTIEINVKGTSLGCEAVIPLMRKNGAGSIINIASVLGSVGLASSSPQYQASKGAVTTLTKHYAIANASYGVRVNSISPGPVLVEGHVFHDLMLMIEKATTDEDEAAILAHPSKGYLDRVPLGRFALPEDVANAVLFLASEDASFITGVDLPVDGGWSAQ